MAGKDDPKPQNTAPVNSAPVKPTMPENRVIKGDDPHPGAVKLIDTIPRKP